MKVIKPVGHRVLVRQDKVDDKLGSILVRPVAHTKEEQKAQVAGSVVAVGADCWREYQGAWASVGDRVLFQRYSGMRIPDGMGGFLEEGNLILLNDLDITAVLIEDEGNG